MLFVWIVLGIGVVALFALILKVISISQRLHPLKRAVARLQERQAAAQQLAEELEVITQKLEARKPLS